MGQLERYGLYVLCVVIVLILGVAIWGGDPANAGTGLDHSMNLPESGSNQKPPGEPDFFDPARIEDSLGGVQLAGLHKQAKEASQPNPSPDAADRQGEAKPVAAAKTYTIKKNDTLDSIARDVLGARRFVTDLQQANPGVDPRKLRPGDVLQLPAVEGAKAVSKTEESKPAPAELATGWREYTVKSGDSPYQISLEMYGTARFANQILEANHITDPKKLKAKTVLRIPPQPGAANAAKK